MTIQRVTRSKADAGRSYDRLSKWYDLLAEKPERRLRSAGLSCLALEPGEQVLEIGPGTGSSLPALIEGVGPAGRIYALDLSLGMLSKSRQRLESLREYCIAFLVRGDGISLPFKKSSFGAVFMSFTLELFDTPEIALVLQECRRVLNPEGRMAVIALSKRAKMNPAVKVYELAHRVFPKVLDCRPIYLLQTLRESGFECLHLQLESLWGLPVEIALARPRYST